MRKFLIPLLMASALVPAAASAQWRNGGHGDREQSSNNDSDQRSEQRASRRQNNDDGGQAPREQRQERPRFERVERVDRVPQAPVVEQQQVQQAPRDNGRDRSMMDGFRRMADEQRRRETGAVEPTRPAPVVQNRNGNDVFVGQRDGRRDDRRDGDRRWGGTADAQRWATRDGSWSRAWRNDNRYDWRRHRDHNRFVFRIGTYYDPYRYGYRRFNVGYNLWPSYYSQNYWLNDPWQYRLPPAWGPYRWVRYYDDALLVNIYTGQVVDVIYGVFW